METPKFRIKVVNGIAVDHPAFEDNLLDAFGAIPPDWEPFVRVLNPTVHNRNLLLLYPEPAYRKINGVWQDYWYYREKTSEELEQEKEAALKPMRDMWANRPYAHNFTTWVLNEETLKFEPPVPRPNDGKFYRWHGSSNNWREAEPIPNDGKRYTFDFDNWINVEVV